MDGLQNPLISIPVSYLVTALLAAGARIYYLNLEFTVRNILGTLLTSLAVVASIYPFLDEKYPSFGINNLLIGIASFYAKNILDVGGAVFNAIRKDPLGVLRDFLNRVKPGG